MQEAETGQTDRLQGGLAEHWLNMKVTSDVLWLRYLCVSVMNTVC